MSPAGHPRWPSSFMYPGQHSYSTVLPETKTNSHCFQQFIFSVEIIQCLINIVMAATIHQCSLTVISTQLRPILWSRAKKSSDYTRFGLDQITLSLQSVDGCLCYTMNQQSGHYWLPCGSDQIVFPYGFHHLSAYINRPCGPKVCAPKNHKIYVTTVQLLHKAQQGFIFKAQSLHHKTLWSLWLNHHS